MTWIFNAWEGFLKVINDLFRFMTNPLNTTLADLDISFLGIDIEIPYIGDMSPIMLITSGLILFILISIALRLIHG